MTLAKRQTAYRIVAASNQARLGGDGSDPLWDSGKIESNQSIKVPYDGTPLESSQLVYWKVRVWVTSPGWAASITQIAPSSLLRSF